MVAKKPIGRSTSSTSTGTRGSQPGKPAPSTGGRGPVTTMPVGTRGSQPGKPAPSSSSRSTSSTSTGTRGSQPGKPAPSTGGRGSLGSGKGGPASGPGKGIK